MIDFRTNPDNQRVIGMIFCYEPLKICVPNITVSSLSTFFSKKPNPDNTADIIENFRKNLISEITSEQTEIIRGAIEKHGLRNKYSPEHLFCFTTSKSEINEFIDLLEAATVNNTPTDISGAFFKIPTATSATAKVISEDIDTDYEYDGTIIKEPIKNLLIIDDVINEGRTLNQLLIRLAIDKKIDNNTVIHVSTLYGFLKAFRPKKCKC